MKWLIIVLPLLFSLPARSQEIRGIGVLWEGDPTEWVIYSDSLKENEVGTLKKRWDNRNDIWDYTFGETSGTIRMKWKSNPDVWQIQSDRSTLLANTIWPGDLTVWSIREEHTTLRYKMRFQNDPEEWETEDSEDYGYFAMWTDREGDIDNWVIYDALYPEKVSLEAKILLVFLPVWLVLQE